MLSGGARGSRDNVSGLPIRLNKGIMGRGSTNRVDTGELAEEDHDVGVDDGAASTGYSDKVEPSEAAGAGVFRLELVEYGVLHDKEFFAVFLQLRPTNTFPDVEGFKGAAFMHEEAGGLGHEEHACQHDGREYEGGTKHISPAAALVGLLASVAILRKRKGLL